MAFRKVSQFKEVTFDFTSTGGTTAVQLYTDMPGAAMAPRLAGKALVNSQGSRATETIPLDGVEGTLFRPELVPASGTVLRLFGGTIWARTIGVYLDGSQGEKWTTQELSLGV